MGMVNTDFTLVLAGALLNANGGYLVMEIEPLLMNPNVWEALKAGAADQAPGHRGRLR